jgi:hypothetical protein
MVVPIRRNSEADEVAQGREHDSKDPDIISHPVDSEAWEALDQFDPEFARTLGVSSLACRWMVSNLTTPKKQMNIFFVYVFIMPYNLSPSKCLKQCFIFLTIVILAPKDPKKEMNIFCVHRWKSRKNYDKG